jgi:hypothetical protein
LTNSYVTTRLNHVSFTVFNKGNAVKFRLLTFGLILMILGLSAAGCGGGGDSEQDIIEITRFLPAEITVFWSADLKQIREDAALAGLYERLMGREYYDAEGALGMGISLSDADIVVMAEDPVGKTHWAVFKGEFDIGSVQQAITSFTIDHGDYEGVEIWVLQGLSMAFYKDYIFIYTNQPGNGDKLIQLCHGEGNSMYDDSGFKAIIEKLPPGFGYSLIKNEYINGQVGGITAYKSDDNIYNIKGWYIFPSDSDAESSLSSIESNLELAFLNTDIECLHQLDLIEIKGELYIENLVASDFWKHYGFTDL